MKTSFAALFAAVGLVAAQSGTLPECANTCTAGFTSGSVIAGCAGGDIACICSNQTFLSEMACCLQDGCNAADQASAIAFAGEICGSVGVTVPTAIVCNSS